MISFVIVNYNLSRELQRCVSTLAANVSRDYEVIVVDNDSTEPDWPACRAWLEARADTSVVARKDNAGFGKACNEGAALAQGELLCFLNPDVVVREDFTDRVSAWLEQHPETAVAGVCTGRSRFMDFSAGPAPGYFLEVLSVFLVGRYVEAFWMRIRGALAGRPFAVGWIMGACLFARKTVFDDLGGFDPDYFLYYEEVDLCFRVRCAGWRIDYDPSICVEHVGSAASKRDYALFTERFYIGKKKFFGKSRTGLQRPLFQSIVQCQIYSQYLLWSLLGLLRAGRAAAKLAGLRRAAGYRLAG